MAFFFFSLFYFVFSFLGNEAGCRVKVLGFDYSGVFGLGFGLW